MITKLKRALEALNRCTKYEQADYDAITDLRTVIAQLEQAEPVAWLVYLPSIQTQEIFDDQDDPGYVDWLTNYDDAVVTPLFAAPVQPVRDTMTDKQIDLICQEQTGFDIEGYHLSDFAIADFARAIEAAAHGAGQASKCVPLTWQPIETAMPEPMVPVLVYNGERVFIEQWWGYDYTFDHAITHWMPLPDAPITKD